MVWGACFFVLAVETVALKKEPMSCFAMKVAALVSGGKDSIFALHKAKEEGHTISCIITLISKNPDSYMFHTPNVSLVSYQAKSMGIPLIEIETDGKKEDELVDLKRGIATAMKDYYIDAVVCGAVHSRYQWERIDTICQDMELMALCPLWGYDQVELLRDLLAAKFEIIFSSVASYGLDKSFLGKTLDANMLEQLHVLSETYGIHAAGEGGEYESLVLDAPLFYRAS